MERISIAPRDGWQAKVEGIGFNWHTPNGQTYWDESAYWKFNATDVEHLRSTTLNLYEMMLDTIEFVISGKMLPLFGYNPEIIALIKKSWEESDNEPTLYGRFDLAYDGVQAKMLEYNGDNPGTLFEASMVQKAWVQDRFPGVGQFNGIHERLVDMFRVLGQLVRTQPRYGNATSVVHLTTLTPSAEGEGTCGYLANCAKEGSVYTKFVGLSDIGWREDSLNDEGYFTDTDDMRIASLIKLAPLGWMLGDEGGESFIQALMSNNLRMIEPAWKLVASNKRILSAMWDRYPYHPALLPTFATQTPDLSVSGYAKKPYNGLEGQNITLVGQGGATVDQTGGSFESDQFVYQELANLAQSGGNFASFGTWLIGGQAVGLSVRESTSAITDAAARFVPHTVE